MSRRIDYRPDIDGLRAVAVVVVVMYHLDVGFVKGGFIGVDVFFVISGYLITRIISSEIESGSFSLVGFYERRVRRLFPALFGVLAFSSAVGYLILFPPELEYFGQTLVAANSFVANILFYNGADYFQGVRDAVPLLHTWSLAVEEQFYLLYPLALTPLLRRSRGKSAVPIFLAAWVLSFALCIFLVKYERSAAFFLLPARAWELLLGCLIALGAFPTLRNNKQREWASMVGLLAILISAGAINRNTLFPGWVALIPCAGAALIIHSGVGGVTLVHRFLSFRPVVFVGLISYSLYLWHWPLIVFYKAHFGFRLSLTAMVLLGAASVAVAALSWRFVETPVRRRTVMSTRKPLFTAAAMATGAAIAVAALFVLTGGLDYRFPENVRQLASFKYDPRPPMREGSCFITRGYSNRKSVDDECLRLDANRRNFLLIGDSHAAHHWAGLAAVFTDINFLQVTASGCVPVLGGGGSSRCRSVVDRAFLEFIPNHKLDAVIIASSWESSSLPALRKTIEAIRRYVPETYIFGPIVAYNDLLPRLLTRSEWLNDPSIVKRNRRPNLASLDELVAGVVESSGGKYVSIYRAMCDSNDNCLTRDKNGDPIQFDLSHLTKPGSVVLSRIWKERGLIE